MKGKWSSKELINIGIFSALFIGINVLISAFVVVPILQFAMMPIMALLTGPIYLLFLAKVGKFGAVMIMGLFTSAFVGLLVYGNVYCFIVNLIFFVVADLIANIGSYKSNRLNNLSFIIVSFWAIGEVGLPWVAGDYFYNLSVESGYPAEWAEGVAILTTPTTFVMMTLAIIVCGIISIVFSKRMLKKHFEKAGVV